MAAHIEVWSRIIACCPLEQELNLLGCCYCSLTVATIISSLFLGHTDEELIDTAQWCRPVASMKVRWDKQANRHTYIQTDGQTFIHLLASMYIATTLLGNVVVVCWLQVARIGCQRVASCKSRELRAKFNWPHWQPSTQPVGPVDHKTRTTLHTNNVTSLLKAGQATKW